MRGDDDARRAAASGARARTSKASAAPSSRNCRGCPTPRRARRSPRRSASTRLRCCTSGKDANEKTVETTDLSHYRIIDFATHGLVPGELNGLTQPALALTAPAVAGVPGDGLLTMEKILALKLDADWVVLSACNTAAGAGAGAEAASGLGQAFFYAGTRTILVTNWSVHSASARELVSDLFRRQAADPTLSRAEALRHAMVGAARRQGLYRRERQDAVLVRAPAVLGALYDHRRRRHVRPRGVLAQAAAHY